MNENVSIEDNRVDNSFEITEKEFTEVRTLIQETVYEQMGAFIAPLTRQSVIDWDSWGDGDNTASRPLSQDWLQQQFCCSRTSAWQLLLSMTYKTIRFLRIKIQMPSK